MQLYILRHAIAENAAPGQPDSDRRLTPKGKSKLGKILARAKSGGVAPDAILTSPYVRAVETAEMAREALEHSGKLIHTDKLTPGLSVVDLWEEVRNHREAEQLMLVGHNPQLETFVCFLTGAPAYGIAMKKGALAFIDVENLAPQPKGTLVWLLTARVAGA